MRSRWEITFEAVDFRFERDHSFDGQANITHADEGAVIPDDTSFRLDLVIDAEQVERRENQRGTMYIEVQGDPTETEDFARYIALQVANKISYDYGQLRLLGGLFAAMRIPENDVEKGMIGDKPYCVTIHLQDLHSAHLKGIIL